MENPFIQLHREFRSAGAKMLISSGQACVLYGISAFSKDGDWIVEEKLQSFDIILNVLAEKGANYRMGAPLDIRWHRIGWTSHFEFQTTQGFRLRADFCSRPPRVNSLEELWERAISDKDHDVVNVEHLILLKKTGRIRDYSMIGALAQIAGLEAGNSEIALQYLQDYDHLEKATILWPEEAKRCSREAVKLLVEGKGRDEVIGAIAREQDESLRFDARRVETIREYSADLQKQFADLKNEWRKHNTPLLDQHQQLLNAAYPLLQKVIPDGRP